MLHASPTSRFFLASLVFVIVVAMIVVASSRRSSSQNRLQWSPSAASDAKQVALQRPDLPANDAGPVGAPEAERAVQQTSVDASREAPSAGSDTESVATKTDEAQDKTSDQKKAAAKKRDKKAAPIRQLSRQFARRKAALARDRATTAVILPPDQLHKPTVAMSQEHRETCRVFVGDAMPAGSLTDADGEKRVLRDLLGKSLAVVVCWNAGNPFALDQFEELTTEVVPLAANGVTVVAIHVGKKPDNYAKLIKEHGTGVTCLLDEDEAYFHALATRRLPRTYVLDEQGKIVWLDIEYSRTTRYELRNAMHYQLQEKK